MATSSADFTFYSRSWSWPPTLCGISCSFSQCCLLFLSNFIGMLRKHWRKPTEFWQPQDHHLSATLLRLSKELQRFELLATKKCSSRSKWSLSTRRSSLKLWWKEVTSTSSCVSTSLPPALWQWSVVSAFMRVTTIPLVQFCWVFWWHTPWVSSSRSRCCSTFREHSHRSWPTSRDACWWPRLKLKESKTRCWPIDPNGQKKDWLNFKMLIWSIDQTLTLFSTSCPLMFSQMRKSVLWEEQVLERVPFAFRSVELLRSLVVKLWLMGLTLPSWTWTTSEAELPWFPRILFFSRVLWDTISIQQEQWTKHTSKTFSIKPK